MSIRLDLEQIERLSGGQSMREEPSITVGLLPQHRLCAKTQHDATDLSEAVALRLK
jgi:hypothetical protein